MFDDLIIRRPAPPNRAKLCPDGEDHFPEAAVMAAFALHLLRTVPHLSHVSIHPDGEHGKRFPLRAWFEKHGFAMAERMGTTPGGLYRSASGQSVLINPKSGRGDVVADADGTNIFAECKGGIVNTTHLGQVSRLRSGLCEAVGQCLASPLVEGMRQLVVVPLTPTTRTVAVRMAARATKAGIEIALMDVQGNVLPVTPEPAKD